MQVKLFFVTFNLNCGLHTLSAGAYLLGFSELLKWTVQKLLNSSNMHANYSTVSGHECYKESFIDIFISICIVLYYNTVLYVNYMQAQHYHIG